MLQKVVKKRRELDEAKGGCDNEKIACEMTAIILESDLRESVEGEDTTVSMESSEIDDGRRDSVDKVLQLRNCLQEMMGEEIFEEAYEVVKNIDLEEHTGDYKVYRAGLKHILSTKDQQQYVPMIQALIEMESF